MISRLTVTAAALAVLATATFAIAASVGRRTDDTVTRAQGIAPVVQLERVVVTAKRLPAQ